jgi:hypothetical protein
MSDTCTICECVRPKNESPGAAELHLEENRSVPLSEIRLILSHGGTDTVGLR